MVRTGAFELQVCVAGAPLLEFAAPSGETYVEARFDTPVTYAQSVQERDPYGEVFTQQWPVTPYTLRIINRSPDHVQAVVFIDGARASRQFVDGGAVGDIHGFKDKSARSAPFREFLFTAPRATRAGEAASLPLNAAQRAALAKTLESIRVKIYASTREGERRQSGDAGSVAAGIDAASKAVARGGGAAAVSAAGRVVGAPRVAKMRRVWRTGGKLATLCVRYTQRHKLEHLGLVAPGAAAAGRAQQRRTPAQDTKPVFIDLT